MRKVSIIALFAALTLIFSSGVFAAEYGSSTRGDDMKSSPAMEDSSTRGADTQSGST
ncbi:MAG: hypothetical protein IT388_04335, partial [Nitrospirales bacterium]|nr:hypothetical protein [Nitrospirales bacterium]